MNWKIYNRSEAYAYGYDTNIISINSPADWLASFVGLVFLIMIPGARWHPIWYLRGCYHAGL